MGRVRPKAREHDVVVPGAPYNVVPDVVHHDPPDVRVVIRYDVDSRECIIVVLIKLVKIPAVTAVEGSVNIHSGHSPL